MPERRSCKSGDPISCKYSDATPQVFNAGRVAGASGGNLNNGGSPNVSRADDLDSAISITHQNVQGLSNKISELEVFFTTNYCHIFCTSEHWCLGNDINLVNIDGFYLIDHFSRGHHTHGGVALFCRDNIVGHPINEIKKLSTEFNFECVAGRFAVDGFNFIVLALYRSPGYGKKDLFLRGLSDALDIIFSRYKKHKIVICGDFNYDFLAESRDLSGLLDLIHSYGIIHTINVPTRNDRCLDNICISEQLSDISTDVIFNGIADHSAQSLIIRNQKIAPKKFSYAYRPLKSGSRVMYFKSLLSCENWSTVYNSCDVNIQYAHFYNVFYFNYNLAFPLRYATTAALQKQRAPWITTGILVSSQRLKDLYKLKSMGVDIDAYYKRYRSVYRATVSLAKRLYNERLLCHSTNMNRAAWRIINPKKARKSTETHLKVDGELIVDPSKCANTFNSYFTFVAHRYPSKISNRKFCSLDRNVDSSFFVTPATQSEIINIIYGLRSSGSSGCDSIDSRTLKSCAAEISGPLCEIVNNSFSSGIFPSLLKVSRCIPLLKKNCPLDIENYRPLSIPSTFSKIIEKLMANRLIEYLDKNELFDMHQHGFRHGRSTSTAIIDYLNELYRKLDNGDACLGVFVDLSKAFDLVDHRLLLDKLYRLGIRGVPSQWIESYLTQRTQYVDLNGVKSDILITNRGVPQGSVLGPLLYIIYVCDIYVDGVTVYADDTSLLVSADNTANLVSAANDALVQLCNYFSDNGLHLNISKTVMVDFTVSHSKTNASYLVRTNRKSIAQSGSTKFLGLYIDRCLTWSVHVDALCGKLASRCFALKTLSHSVGLPILRRYYFGYIHSLISYAIIAWGASSGCSRRVLILQKRAVRIMMGVSRLTSCRGSARS